MKRKLSENLKRIEDRIEAACAKAGRERDDVTMVAVTKSVGVEVIQALVDLGIRDLGESKVQELSKRAAAIEEWLKRRALDNTSDERVPVRPRWHMIGHLQRNKVKTLLPWTQIVHSVDSLRLAEEISTHSVKLGRTTQVLLEVNASGEEAKYGVAVAAATHLASEIASLPNLTVRGLMGMAPFTDDSDVIRRVFWRVRELFDEAVSDRVCGPDFNLLSLGMSSDFEHAIEVGATHVRIGTALFEGIDAQAESVTAD